MIPKNFIILVWKNPSLPIVRILYRKLEKHLPDFEIIEWNEDNFDYIPK